MSNNNLEQKIIRKKYSPQFKDQVLERADKEGVPQVAKAAKKIRQTVKQKWKLKMRTDLDLHGLARLYNPAIQGWINYYGRFHGSVLYSKMFEHLNTSLMRWAMKKYKQLHKRPTRASAWLKRTQLEYPNLFAHWRFKTT